MKINLFLFVKPELFGLFLCMFLYQLLLACYKQYISCNCHICIITKFYSNKSCEEKVPTMCEKEQDGGLQSHLKRQDMTC